MSRSVLNFLAAAFVTLLVLSVPLGFWSSSHDVTAEFTNADGLVAGNNVVLHGIEVGTVKSVGISGANAGSDYVTVTMSISNRSWPLRSGTTFAIRPHGALGNVYVELNPGGGDNSVLSPDHRFGLRETSSIVTLDELNNVFTPSVRTALQTQAQQGAIALGGDGASNLNQTIANADPLVADAVPIAGVLDERSPQLDRLNTEFARVSSDLGREDANLRGLIASSDATLAAIAGKASDAQGTLVNAAGTLTSIDSGLASQTGNLANIFKDGPSTLMATKSATDSLTTLIDNVNPHVASLDQLLQEFVSATGFTTGTGVDTLRVDATLAPAGYKSFECGGQPREQSGVVGCPRGAS